MNAQYNPFLAPLKVYGAKAQDTIPIDATTKFSKERIEVVQQVAGGVLYYIRAVDCTVLTALSSIASNQSEATKGTEKRIQQLLNYLTT